jgi:hypothetical protein
VPFNMDLDARQPELNASQRRQVEQLVRRAGKTCEVCDSDDLSCDDRAVRTMPHGISVRLFCNNRKGHADGVVGTEQPCLLSTTTMRTGLASSSDAPVRRVGPCAACGGASSDGRGFLM